MINKKNLIMLIIRLIAILAIGYIVTSYIIGLYDLPEVIPKTFIKHTKERIKKEIKELTEIKKEIDKQIKKNKEKLNEKVNTADKRISDTINKFKSLTRDK